MPQIFIELFNYKPAWRGLPAEMRNDYVSAVLNAVNLQRSSGVEVIGWGFNDLATDRRAPYDFYCVYRTPSADFQRQFEAEIAAAGWHEYFEQVQVSGAVSTPEALLRSYAELEEPQDSRSSAALSVAGENRDGV